MKLAPENSKMLAKKYLLASGMSDGNFIYAHTVGVVNAARLLGDRYKLDVDFLESVAWVHDIGQVRGVKGHAEASLIMLEEEGIEIDEVIRDCVLNHGNGKAPKTREGEVINIADKVSIIDRDFLKELLGMEEIAESHIDFVRMIFDGAIDRLKKVDHAS